ncbi:MAG: NADH:flavin oxidoreductase [Erysipelotrichaceae bacterium]|nr:NADH:flavin oxidoreductase [Erysipelotrichaceae bacterium]
MLEENVSVGKLNIKNRICVPPMWIKVYAREDGFVTAENIEHYRGLAQGGAGLIIQEATCVNKEGMLADVQMGIWSDEHVEGLKKITEAVHEAGGKIIIQIHHAGILSTTTDDLVSASDYTIEKRGKSYTARAMSTEEVEQTVDDFIKAAHRAYAAGYDGIELHGCHSYLLSQFFNKRLNKRTDRYADPLVLVQEIMDGIKDLDFVKGIRLGCFEPTLEDGIAHARALEAMGMEFLDISGGFGFDCDETVPQDWKYTEYVYGAMKIKEKVNIPVFAVNGIETAEQAEAILQETGVDMVDIGRCSLVDPAWADHALTGQKTGKCLHCPNCYFYGNAKACAGKLMMKKQ